MLRYAVDHSVFSFIRFILS